MIWMTLYEDKYHTAIHREQGTIVPRIGERITKNGTLYKITDILWDVDIKEVSIYIRMI